MLFISDIWHKRRVPIFVVSTFDRAEFELITILDMTKPRSRKYSTASAPADCSDPSDVTSFAVQEEDELEWIRAAVNASPVNYEKPTVSYASLIGKAISKAPEQRARLSTIYHYISARYPYYQLDQGG